MHDTSISLSMHFCNSGMRAATCAGSAIIDGAPYIPQRWADELSRRCTEWLDWRAGLRGIPAWHKLAKQDSND